MRAFLHPRTFTRSQALLVALLLAGLAGLTTQRAQAQIGGAAVVFLMIEPDARSAGMGNTGVAIADNANATFWNPAGLAYQRGAEAGLTHSNWLPEFNAGLFYEYGVGKYHVDGVGTFGAHITYLFLGENEWRDDTGTELGTFKSYDLALGASYGFNLTQRFALGTSVRLIYSNLAPDVDIAGVGETKAGVSAGIDLAGLYRSAPFSLGSTNATISAGFNLANMGPTIEYTDSERGADPIPTNLRFGYAFTVDFDEYNTITFANDFNKMLINVESDPETNAREVDPFYQAIFSAWRPLDIKLNPNDEETVRVGVMDQITMAFGLEYWYNKQFAFRTGYFYESPYNGNREFLTFGAGLRYNIIGVDFSYIYAIEEKHPLANTMRFSLLINILN